MCAVGDEEPRVGQVSWVVSFGHGATLTQALPATSLRVCTGGLEVENECCVEKTASGDLWKARRGVA